MKFFIASALFLLFAAQATMAQWETLSEDAYGEIPYLAELRKVGLSYVIQKGKYESTRSPLPGKNYMNQDNNDGTIERRNTSTVTYYRWNLTLVEAYEEDGSEGDSLVKTSFTVSYRSSNSNFLVTSYRYTVDPDGNAPDEDDEEASVDFEGSSDDALDTRPFNNGTGDLSPILSSATDDIVNQAIENGDLPDSEYSTRYVYSVSISTPNELIKKTLICYVKLVNTEGNYFLVRIEADYDIDEQYEEEEAESNRYSVLIG